MNNNAYWNEYYRQRADSKILIPSQFATFVAGELVDEYRCVVDVGCGNGRDSLFFARHGLKVVGVDAAVEAVDLCRRQADGLDATFVCSDVADPMLVTRIRDAAGRDEPLLVYARFFLHAIDQDQEAVFLRAASELCEGGGCLALEFRTVRDRQLAKETAPHFRRYIDPLDVVTTALTFGFRLDYFVEGFGYAKYRKDDAHVARLLLRRVQ